MNDINDATLHINTDGLDETHADTHHFRYEPTPYEVILRLCESGLIKKEHHLLDIGCGKGRVALTISHLTGCHCTGIDFDERLIQIANENQSHLIANTTFICEKAENYPLTNEDCFYFFNPFSERILRTVISHIIESYYENPRKLMLFFYYPSDDTLAYLMGINELICMDEIDCSDLFANDDRERIVVFETISD